MPTVVPEWAQRPPEPFAYARTGWAKLSDGVNDGKDRAQLAVVLLGAWYVLTSRPWVPFLLVVGAWLTALAYGLGTVWLARTGAAPWKWTARGATIATAGTFLLGAWMLVTGGLFATLLLAVGAAQGFAYRPAQEAGAGRWYAHQRMAAALVTAKALSKQDGGIPTLGYIGRPTTDTVGTWVTFRLPPGATWRHVVKQHAELASALGVDPDLLHIEQKRGRGDAVTIALLRERGDVADAPVLPERTDFTQPVPLGADRLGRLQFLKTLGTHTVLVAKTRAGKSWLARWFMCWALKDPAVPVWMISGKDDPEDWQPMQKCCDRYVTGRDLHGILELLRYVERVADYRGTLPKRDRHPAVLMIDEWYVLRNRADVADPNLGKELRKMISNLASTLASRNVHMVMTFQRGTDTFVDSDLRANLGQKLIGMTVKAAEVRTMLDDLDVQVLPSKPGEFLLSLDDSDPTLFQGPKVDDDEFAAICDEAYALRQAEPHAPPLPADIPTDTEVVLDPFAAAVLAALEGGPMTPTALRQSVAPGLTPHAFAARIKAVDEVKKGSGGTDGKLRVYRRVDRRADSLRATNGGLHAQMGAPAAELSEASALP